MSVTKGTTSASSDRSSVASITSAFRFRWGALPANQLSERARLAEVYGNGEIRLTTTQNVILPNVPDRKIGDLVEEPLLKELRYDPPEIIRGLVSCTGIDYCNLALIETKKRALKVAKALAPRLPGKKPISVRWSGCPAGCGNHSWRMSDW